LTLAVYPAMFVALAAESAVTSSPYEGGAPDWVTGPGLGFCSFKLCICEGSS
jgi:hypothetical protein